MKKIIPLLTLACLASAIAQAQQSPDGPRPNVILIMTDDQGYGDLSCHGHPFLKTPQLDQLHAESIRLTNYHASPLCGPTRATVSYTHLTLPTTPYV